MVSPKSLPNSSHTHYNLLKGVAKESLGYTTPHYESESPETQLTTIGSEQKLVEQVQASCSDVYDRYLHESKLDWIIWVLMVPANGLIKLSCIFLYRRIFVINKWSPFDIVTKFSVVIVIIWTVSFFFATIFGCGQHFDYPWRPLVYISMCDTNNRLDALMISDLLTDVLVWVQPIPVVRKSNIKITPIVTALLTVLQVWKLNMKTLKIISITGILLLAAM